MVLETDRISRFDRKTGNQSIDRPILLKILHNIGLTLTHSDWAQQKNSSTESTEAAPATVAASGGPQQQQQPLTEAPPAAATSGPSSPQASHQPGLQLYQDVFS
ncbi:hypothetical protein PIB30_049438 [Stylosanthes scabra]|uniref:Uncharacterized protein n=1 Tax=Stylosanthes scabra TaxID=79078 RepID=A0ABU6TH38_9FABA|nr:hypothetical protein [Stylosanthes scabra]